jgi:cell wall-associated NlpC family hydrolase
MPHRADVIAAARACLGTPFRDQGRLPGIGLDCAGLLLCVGNRLGLTPHKNFDVTGYARYPREVEVRRHLRLTMDPVYDFAARKPGDVLLFADNRDAVHMGILAAGSKGEETVIHATARLRQVVEHGLDAAWLAHLRAIYRFRGLEEDERR